MSSRRILIGLLILYTLNIIYVDASIAFNRLPSPLFSAFSTLVPFAIALTHAQDLFPGYVRMLAGQRFHEWECSSEFSRPLFDRRMGLPKEFYRKAPRVINCDFGEGDHGMLW